MSQVPSRRDVLKGALKTSAIATAVAAGGVLLPTGSRAAEPTATASTATSRRVLRFAHPTDIHVQPELRGGEGMAAALKHMMGLKDPPQMLVTGGDFPMDSAATPRERSAMLWKLFSTVWRDNIPANLPVHHTIGNHDIWGRDKAACGARGDEPFFGKKWFLDVAGTDKTYYSFDQAGWHFIVLDSFDLDPVGKDYTSRIVGAQLDWLKADLAATPATTPVVVVTHVPILSAASFFDKSNEKASKKKAKKAAAAADEYGDGDANAVHETDMVVERTRVHVDHRELDALFLKHGNVKLCLSGHLHLLDRVEYNGVTYLCDGAICGNKWKGPRRQTREGYGIIDLYADGTFQHQYVSYGWEAGKNG